MDRIDRKELEGLVRAKNGPCVALYMPTERTAAQRKQNLIRFSNLIREAEEHLVSLGYPQPKAREFLEPARSLAGKGDFWEHQGDGLACFLSAEHLLCYRLPLTFDEKVVISDHFHIKPLFPLLFSIDEFFILALSLGGVKLLRCDRYGSEEVGLAGVPVSLSEALKYDQPQKQLQYHTGTPGGAGGQRAAMFHGQGTGTDEHKENIHRFFQLLGRGLHQLLATEAKPVILAGVEYLLPIFKEAYDYPLILEPSIAGNPEGVKAEELRREGWKIMEPYSLAKQAMGAARYEQLVGRGRTSTRVEEVIVKAYQGEVDTLFLSAGVQQWGVLDERSLSVATHECPLPGDADLLDLAGVYTYLNGGTVYVVPQGSVPGGALLAAILRY